MREGDANRILLHSMLTFSEKLSLDFSIFFLRFIIEWEQIAHIQSSRFMSPEEVNVVGALNFRLHSGWPVGEPSKFRENQGSGLLRSQIMLMLEIGHRVSHILQFPVYRVHALVHYSVSS